MNNKHTVPAVCVGSKGPQVVTGSCQKGLARGGVGVGRGEGGRD